MKTQLPPIYRDCRRLLLHTEQVVRQFSRYHKYTVGTDLRQKAMCVMRTVHLAVYDKPHLAQHIHSLVWAVAKTASPKTADALHVKDHVLRMQDMAGPKPVSPAQARSASLSTLAPDSACTSGGHAPPSCTPYFST